jgi:hypothetical protein
MTTVDERRQALQMTLRPYDDTVTRVRRAYFDAASVALADKHEIEFEIKRAISDRYSIPFRSVVFAGSAQLGFSPQKDTEFSLGSSDLDVGCIDVRLYQEVWQIVIRQTRAFTDLSQFHNEKHAEMLRNGMLKRGMILLDFMPRCPERTAEQEFFDDLSRRYRKVFSRIGVAIYMNEWAFCWKQQSALSSIVRFDNAE